MSPQTSDTIGALVCLLVAVGLLLWGRRMRRNERAKTATLEGYSHVARCSCGWEIGADHPEDADAMLALHRAVKPHPDLLDAEWRRLATLPARDWPVA